MAPRRRVTMLVRNAYTNDTRVEREAMTLDRAGYDVTVVCDAGPGLPVRDERDGIAVRRVPRAGLRLPGLRYLAHLWRLRRAVRATRPHILHAHDTDALTVVGPLASADHIPFVFDSHELWLGRSARGHARWYHGVAQAFFGWVERRYVPRAGAVLVANPPVGPILERRYGVTGVVSVPNYPELTTGPARDLRDLPGAEGIHPTAAVVLYVGGITIERGIEQLVDAMVRISDAHLVFLGGGGLEPQIRARVQASGIGERTHFLGMVPSAEVVPLAASATVGIISTPPTSLNNRYALPNKLFQYMAAGIPVVASDFPQIREVVEGSSCGTTYDPGDVDALVREIRAYLDDPDRARADGGRGRKAVEDRYHWQIAASRLLELYAAVEAL